MTDKITKEKILNHPIQKVWDAITKAEEISTWFIKADFKAENGYKYTFIASEKNDCVPITGEVLQSNPYVLEYTWIVENTNVETVVKWQLETVDEGTRLCLEHSGISKYEGNTAITMFESFNGGWDGCINQLTEYLKQDVNAR